MAELPEGFPKRKGPKAKKFGSMSAKTTAKMEERKEVVAETHRRSGGVCQAKWIVPDVPCSRRLHADELHTRGRFGGVTAYNLTVTQSLCSRCDFCKENEVRASEILGLYGQQGVSKHAVTDELIAEAKKLFRQRKLGCHFS